LYCFYEFSFVRLPGKNPTLLDSSGNDPMDVDDGNVASNDQDLPAERFVHHLEFTKLHLELYLCLFVAILYFS
jgi:hypothetical protein